jgi:hypothetical protein
VAGFGVDRGSGSSAGSADGVLSETLVDAKGDLLVGTAANTIARLAVGTNEKRLVADSVQAEGLKYVADTTNYAIAAKGDLLAGTAADTLAALTVGANGEVLVADSTQATGTKWQALGLAPSATSGRLTLTTATPVTSADVAGATTVYFTPYKGNVIQLYDGTNWVALTLTELSQATTDSTKSPAAVVVNSNYDVFVWTDSGTLRATRGPAWTSDTARGTGAATTELELFQGRYVNKVDITNGPAARRGLYVGSIRSNASSQINDTSTLRHVWNNFNRILRSMLRTETTASWTYSTAAFQQANAASANQLDHLVGLAEDTVTIEATGAAMNSTATGRAVGIGIGVDSVTVNSATMVMGQATAVNTGPTSHLRASYVAIPAVGRHYYVWLEKGAGTDTQTWNGLTGEYKTGISGTVFA